MSCDKRGGILWVVKKSPHPALSRRTGRGDRFRCALLLLMILTIGGCVAAKPRVLSFAQGVAAAHGVEEWEVEQALQGELLVRYNTMEVVDLRFVIEVDGERVRLVVGDGTPEGKTTVMV